MSFVIAFVANAECVDSISAGVGKQFVAEILVFRETFVCFPFVVTDRHDLQAELFKFVDFAVQLDQLVLAERSPVG